MSHLTYEYQLPKGIFQVFNERPSFDFTQTKQIHSAKIVCEEIANSMIEADGIKSTSNKPQCILTADCLPIVIEGELGHISLHAGWAGVRDQIVLSDEVIAIKPLTCFIGPHICENCYEVQVDFKKHFPQSTSFVEKSGKLYFSLQKEIIHQLKNQFPNLNILCSNQCTFEQEKFHSFRRDKTKLRNFNIYIPQGELK